MFLLFLFPVIIAVYKIDHLPPPYPVLLHHLRSLHNYSFRLLESKTVASIHWDPDMPQHVPYHWNSSWLDALEPPIMSSTLNLLPRLHNNRGLLKAEDVETPPHILSLKLSSAWCQRRGKSFCLLFGIRRLETNMCLKRTTQTVPY